MEVAIRRLIARPVVAAISRRRLDAAVLHVHNPLVLRNDFRAVREIGGDGVRLFPGQFPFLVVQFGMGIDHGNRAIDGQPSRRRGIGSHPAVARREEDDPADSGSIRQNLRGFDFIVGLSQGDFPRRRLTKPRHRVRRIYLGPEMVRVRACHDSVLIAVEGNAGLLISDFGINREVNPVALNLKELNYLGSAGIKSHDRLLWTKGTADDSACPQGYLLPEVSQLISEGSVMGTRWPSSQATIPGGRVPVR